MKALFLVVLHFLLVGWLSDHIDKFEDRCQKAGNAKKHSELRWTSWNPRWTVDACKCAAAGFRKENLTEIEMQQVLRGGWIDSKARAAEIIHSCMENSRRETLFRKSKEQKSGAEDSTIKKIKADLASSSVFHADICFLFESNGSKCSGFDTRTGSLAEGVCEVAEISHRDFKIHFKTTEGATLLAKVHRRSVMRSTLSPVRYAKRAECVHLSSVGGCYIRKNHQLFKYKFKYPEIGWTHLPAWEKNHCTSQCLAIFRELEQTYGSHSLKCRYGRTVFFTKKSEFKRESKPAPPKVNFTNLVPITTDFKMPLKPDIWVAGEIDSRSAYKAIKNGMGQLERCEHNLRKAKSKGWIHARIRITPGKPARVETISNPRFSLAFDNCVKSTFMKMKFSPVKKASSVEYRLRVDPD